MENFEIQTKINQLNGSYIFCGDALSVMQKIPSKSIDLVFTSPPYAGGIRNYNKNGEPSENDIGQSSTEEYVERFIPYVKEISRLLRYENGGVFILNIGERYSDGFASKYPNKLMLKICEETPLDFIDEMPWIKCLSSNTSVISKIDNFVMSITLKSLSKIYLDKKKKHDIMLWNGRKWVRLYCIRKNKKSNGIKIIFKNGYSVKCTLTHKWIRKNGKEVVSSDLLIGDVLFSSSINKLEDSLFLNSIENNLYDFQVVEIKDIILKSSWDISIEDISHKFVLSSGLVSKNSDPMPNKNSKIGTLGWEHIYIFGSKNSEIIRNLDFMKSPYKADRLKISKRRNYNFIRKQTGQVVNDAKCYRSIGALPRNYIVSDRKEPSSYLEYQYLEEHYCISSTQGNKDSYHMAQMPIRLAEYFIGGFSKSGAYVLDCFGGSGTTAVAAKSLGRKFICIDLFKENCNLIKKRVDNVFIERDLFNYYGIPEKQDTISKDEEEDLTKMKNIF